MSCIIEKKHPIKAIIPIIMSELGLVTIEIMKAIKNKIKAPIVLKINVEILSPGLFCSKSQTLHRIGDAGLEFKPTYHLMGDLQL